MRLILIRGISGSGKSTLARHLLSQPQLKLHRHVEADMFFENNPEGEYRFNSKRLREAHEWCLARAVEALEKGESVVVANTFTTRKEMKPYFELAEKYGMRANVITANGNFKSIHNVPESVIERQKARWED